jgi:hypothetical protein
VREHVRNHLQARAVTHAIYQTVIVLAIVVSLERHPPPDGTLLVYVIGGAIAVGLADLYAGVVGRMIRERQPVNRRMVKDDAVAILQGIAVAVALPIVFFGLHRLGLLAVQRAFDLTEWTELVLIGLYAFVANRFAGFSVRHSLLLGAATTLIGLLLVGLKALFH